MIRILSLEEEIVQEVDGTTATMLLLHWVYVKSHGA